MDKLGSGFYKIIGRFGFLEDYNIGTVLASMPAHGVNFTMEKISFFLGRERILLGKRSRMSPWRTRLFAIMSRNAQEGSTYYNIPADQVIEVGVRLEF